jgi:hypothetical protein
MGWKMNAGQAVADYGFTDERFFNRGWRPFAMSRRDRFSLKVVGAASL